MRSKGRGLWGKTEEESSKGFVLLREKVTKIYIALYNQDPAGKERPREIRALWLDMQSANIATSLINEHRGE